jgi:hypothetical protein
MQKMSMWAWVLGVSSAMTVLAGVVLLLIKPPSGNSNPTLATIIDCLWIFLAVISAILCFSAIALQITGWPDGDEDWTFSAGIGAGISANVVLTQWILPHDWWAQLPKAPWGLISGGVMILAFYLIFIPLLRRRSP